MYTKFLLRLLNKYKIVAQTEVRVTEYKSKLGIC